VMFVRHDGAGCYLARRSMLTGVSLAPLRFAMLRPRFGAVCYTVLCSDFGALHVCVTSTHSPWLWFHVPSIVQLRGKFSSDQVTGREQQGAIGDNGGRNGYCTPG